MRITDHHMVTVSHFQLAAHAKIIIGAFCAVIAVAINFLFAFVAHDAIVTHFGDLMSPFRAIVGRWLRVRLVGYSVECFFQILFALNRYMNSDRIRIREEYLEIGFVENGDFVALVI